MGDNDVLKGSGDVPGWRPRGGAHIKTALDWAGLSYGCVIEVVMLKTNE